MPDDLRPPYRIQFDNARDPYAARNALGITSSGGGLITSVSPPLSVTGGNLTVDLSGLQPIDADLTSIAGYAGTGTWLYRSAANTWSPVTVGTGLSFSGGALTCTVSTSGFQPLDATLTALAAFNTNGLLTQTAADTFTGRTLTGPAAGIIVTNGNGVAGNPTLGLADDLAALEALIGTNIIYYRSGTNAWSPVTIGTGLAFSGGTLTAAAGGGFTSVVSQKFTASGTYTPTSGMKFCIIEVVGGGGGGGGGNNGSTSYTGAGGGGGSGAYSRTYATAATVGASQTVTIGVGNTGGAGSANGGTGGNSAVGTLCTAGGGGGGFYFQSNVQVPSGGAGGGPGSGDVTAAGEPGGPGYYNVVSNATIVAAGNGGSSIFGGGARGVSNTQSNGTNASNYGSGGSGACAHAVVGAYMGGQGSPGVVIITEFI